MGSNIYQHQQDGNCKLSIYIAIVADSNQLLYNYLEQRSKEYPNTYSDPGDFIMLGENLVSKLMEVFPIDVLKHARDMNLHWTIFHVNDTLYGKRSLWWQC